MTRFIAVMFGVCLLCAGRAQAQQVIPAPTSYTLATFSGAVVDPNAAGVSAINSVSYPVSAVICGQTKDPTVVQGVVNPTRLVLDDPADNQKDCQITVTTQVSAVALGIGYRFALKANAGPAASPFSNLSNTWNRVSTSGLAPLVPSGVRTR